MPTHNGAASALWKFGNSRIILLFGGEEHEGTPESSTRHLTAIDIDKRVWWHEDALQWEKLSPRHHPIMAITENHIYIFGGLGMDATGRQLIPMKTFAVATFEITTNRWCWVVLDQGYPNHVPNLGHLGDYLPVDGQKRILLTPGLIGKAEKVRIFMRSRVFNWLILTASSQVNFSRDIVLFDTEHHTFEVVKIAPGIRLPKGIRFYHLHNQPPPSNIPGLQAETPMIESELEADSDMADSITPSDVVFTTWGALSRDVPEIWRLSLQSAEFQCLYLEKHLEDLNVSTCESVVVDKRLFLLGTRSIEDEQSYLDVAVEIAL